MRPRDPTPSEIAAECAAIRAEKRLCNRCHRPNVVLTEQHGGGWICDVCRSIEQTDDDLDDLYEGSD